MKRLMQGIGVLALAVAMPVAGQSDERAVLSVVTGFGEALAAGDSTRALAYLADDVRILESGNVEDLDHYRNGHLRGDMVFAQAVTRDRSAPHVVILGDVAWVTSSADVSGSFRGRQINSVTAETMVLSRNGNGWIIRSIHWSSRQRN